MKHQRVRRATLTVAVVILAMVGLPQGPAQALERCKTWQGLNTEPAVQAVPGLQCVLRDANRGYRGQFEFLPYGRDFQSVGRFYVTLSRNGDRVAKSVTHVNPNFRDTSKYVPYLIATPWVQTTSGTYCTRLWDSRTVDQDYVVAKHCTDF